MQILIIQNIKYFLLCFQKYFEYLPITGWLSHSKWVPFHLCIIFSFFCINRVTRGLPVPLGSGRWGSHCSPWQTKGVGVKEQSGHWNLLARPGMDLTRVRTHEAILNLQFLLTAQGMAVGLSAPSSTPYTCRNGWCALPAPSRKADETVSLIIIPTIRGNWTGGMPFFPQTHKELSRRVRQGIFHLLSTSLKREKYQTPTHGSVQLIICKYLPRTLSITCLLEIPVRQTLLPILRKGWTHAPPFGWKARKRDGTGLRNQFASLLWFWISSFLMHLGIRRCFPMTSYFSDLVATSSSSQLYLVMCSFLWFLLTQCNGNAGFLFAELA